MGSLQRPTLLVDCSTVDVATAREVAAGAEAQGHRMIDAPVSGGTHAGGPGNGQAAKVCNNMMAAINVLGAAEGFALDESLGVAREVLFDIVSTSSGLGDLDCSAVFELVAPR